MERRNTMVRTPTKIYSETSLNLSDTSDDLDMVLERSRLAGVKSMIITGGSLHESKEALELAQTYGPFSTRKTILQGGDRRRHRFLCDNRMPSNTVRPVRQVQGWTKRISRCSRYPNREAPSRQRSRGCRRRMWSRCDFRDVPVPDLTGVARLR
jgi:hypothetical protein